MGRIVCYGLWGWLEVGKVLFGCLCIISQLPDRPEPVTTSQVVICVQVLMLDWWPETAPGPLRAGRPKTQVMR